MPRVFDYFCGMGGFSKGFKDAGYEIEEGIDNWRISLNTFEKYIKARGREADISDYFPTKNDFEVIIVGGSPCQDFSRLNIHRDIFSKRSQLLIDFCRIVNAVQPEVFVFENVIHLPKYCERALFDIPRYKTTKTIVNTANYGIPQSRRRKIFIGCKSRHIDMTSPPVYEVMTVRDAFNLIEENWGLSNHRAETIEKFKKVHSTSWVSKEPTSDYKGIIRLSWDTPACAIVNIKKSQILHPEEDRVISTAEALALQGFPPWYIPFGNECQRAIQVANAIPPKLAYHIALRILGSPLQTRLTRMRNYQ